MAVTFTDEQYRLFSEWLADRYGLRFGPEKRDILRSRLDASRAELGLGTFEQLYFHLKFHPLRADDLDRLLTSLTNNESYFLRERRQLELLCDEVLPILRRRQRRDNAPIRILSAGCASGEEAYSLAITVARCGVVPLSEVRITGLDIDPQALERARHGLYREHALRGVEPDVRDRYFRREGDLWRLSSVIRRSVLLRRTNLVEPGWSESFPPQHVVFCRNVLIYFDDAATRRLLQEVGRVLAPGGLLFLGHSESLSRTPTPFEAVRRSGAIYYRLPES